MARPSATSSRIEPRLTPVNSTPSAFAPGQAALDRRPATRSIAALTSGSVSSARRSISSDRVAGCRLSAEQRRGVQPLRPVGRRDQRPPARSSASCVLQLGVGLGGRRLLDQRQLGFVGRSLRSIAMACGALGAVGRQQLQRRPARRRVRARMRLLLMTSSASAGSATASPLAGVDGLVAAHDEGAAAGDTGPRRPAAPARRPPAPGRPPPLPRSAPRCARRCRPSAMRSRLLRRQRQRGRTDQQPARSQAAGPRNQRATASAAARSDACRPRARRQSLQRELLRPSGSFFLPLFSGM